MIYVDWLCNHGFEYFGDNVLSCHMFSDENRQELITFASKLGFKIFISQENVLLYHSYLHISRVGIPHFDLTKSKRDLAISKGAIELTKENYREFLRKIRNVYDKIED